MVEYPKYGNNNRLPETIVVFPDLEIASLFGGEHVELTGHHLVVLDQRNAGHADPHVRMPRL